MTASYYDRGGAKSPADARVLLRHLKVPALGSVLDVGCGDGVMLELAQERATHLAGVDSSAEAISLTLSRLPHCNVRVADAEGGLPFGSDEFNTVFFCDIIEHLKQPVFALEEVYRVLRRDGRVLVTTPNAASIFRVLKGRRWFGLSDPGHVLFYTPFSLAHLLATVGFIVERRGIEGLTNTPLDPLLAFTRSGGTIVMTARKA